MIILTIKDGILKEVLQEKEQDEMKKDNWQYRLTTASQQFTIIDYDKDLARPYVKAILAKVNKLKEVKMLWAVIIILVFLFLFSCVFSVITLLRLNDLWKWINTINTTKTTNIPAAANINRLPDNNKDFDSLDNEATATGKTKITTNNHLLR